MVALALAFLGLYAMQVLWRSIPPTTSAIAQGLQYAIWAVFIADFAYRIVLAPRRWKYALSHPLDILTLILPMLRPLRALRIFAAARVLIERGAFVSYGRVAAAIGGTAAFIVLVGALVVLDFERAAPDSSIQTFGQAVWWGIVTITTVGYGDLSPVTGGGQAAAAMLMIVGISLIGAVTASFAAWFTQRVQGAQSDANREILDQLAEVREELATLRAQMSATERR
ncbi:MAG TPA: ion channel [Actinomycetota bacterium]|nr:ion channel [Actinomycetota bacterium]